MRISWMAKMVEFVPPPCKQRIAGLEGVGRPFETNSSSGNMFMGTGKKDVSGAVENCWVPYLHYLGEHIFRRIG